MQDTSHHAANLLIAETKDDNCPKNCVQHLEWLDTLTKNDTCPLMVIADNFHDYDGYFVVDEFHRRHWQIGQIHNGSKLMQVTPDQISFIDALLLPKANCLRFRRPLVSKSWRVFSHISLITPTIRSIWVLSPTKSTTCQKPCQSMVAKLLKMVCLTTQRSSSFRF